MKKVSSDEKKKRFFEGSRDTKCFNHVNGFENILTCSADPKHEERKEMIIK
jgi:hypothetical protein